MEADDFYQEEAEQEEEKEEQVTAPEPASSGWKTAHRLLPQACTSGEKEEAWGGSRALPRASGFNTAHDVLIWRQKTKEEEGLEHGKAANPFARANSKVCNSMVTNRNPGVCCVKQL